MTAILIVDDHPIVSVTLSAAARSVVADATLVTAGTLAEAERVGEEQPFDLVMLDLMLPDASGFAGLVVLRRLQPDATIAIVSARDDAGTVRQAVELGARGFLSKSLSVDRMGSAIRVLLEGGAWLPEGALADAPPADDMTTRIAELSAAQLRVLRAIAGGKQNKQIAFELNLAEPTIKSHLAAIFRKLGVANRTQAVVAYRGLDDLPREATD